MDNANLELEQSERDEIEKAWIQEALRRKAQLESGEVEGIPAEEVLRELRNLGSEEA